MFDLVIQGGAVPTFLIERLVAATGASAVEPRPPQVVRLRNAEKTSAFLETAPLLANEGLDWAFIPSGKKLSELIAPYHRYEKSEEINLPIRDHKAAASALSHVASAFRGAAIDRTDGISADMWDSQGWWFNLRLSNTEPLLRLVVEAKGKDLLDTKIAEVRKLLLP